MKVLALFILTRGLPLDKAVESDFESNAIIRTLFSLPAKPCDPSDSLYNYVSTYP